ncbi:MAG: NfeD family protein [Planctomycetota bacterium]|nr:NfeD family protein [Planctomycetota bacterium]
MRQLFRWALCAAIFSTISLVNTHLVFAEEKQKAGLAGVISISRDIDEFEASAFQIRLEKSLAKKPTHIIIKINSRNGRSKAAERIAKSIQKLEDLGIQTIAYITGDASSVAALVAVSCKKIVMAPGSRIGAALPDPKELQESEDSRRMRDGVEDLPPENRVLQTWKVGFEIFALNHIKDELIVQAMLENKYGLMRVVFRGREKKRNIVYMSKREFFGLEEDAREGVLESKVLAEPGETLVLNDQQAKEISLIFRGNVDSLKGLGEALKSSENLASFEVFELSNLWWLHVIGVCQNSYVKMFLFALGVVALIVAFSNPGTGAAEVLAALAFILVFGSSYFAGFASYVEILIFLLGLILIAMEVFVIPGFGVTGVLGTALVLASFLLTLQSFILPTTSAEWDIFGTNLIKTVISFTMAGLIVGALVRFFGHNLLFKRLILKMPGRDTSAVVVGSSSKPERLIGLQGTVHSTMRPVGEVRLGDEILEAVSEESFLEPGVRVEVVGRRGFSALVRRLPDKAASKASPKNSDSGTETSSETESN